MIQIRHLQGQRGTSTLEMILALPFLLFLLFGIAEISRLFHTLNIVTTAARDGARVGVVTPATPGNVFDAGPAAARVNSILAASNLTATTLTVTCSTPCVPDSQVQATVGVTFQTVIPLLGNFVPVLGAPINVSQTTIMRRE